MYRILIIKFSVTRNTKIPTMLLLGLTMHIRGHTHIVHFVQWAVEFLQQHSHQLNTATISSSQQCSGAPLCKDKRRSVWELTYYMWNNHHHIEEAWDGTAMMYKHGTHVLVIFSAYQPREAELSTLQKPVPLGVKHADSEMLSTSADQWTILVCCKLIHSEFTILHGVYTFDTSCTFYSMSIKV